MLVESGKTVFIGGLIRRSDIKTREGVPVLGDVPGLGLLFSNKAINSVNTELVVLITPYIIDQEGMTPDLGNLARIEKISEHLEIQKNKIGEHMNGVKRFEDTLAESFGAKEVAVQTDAASQNSPPAWIYD